MKYRHYLVRRILHAIPVFFGLMLLIFLVSRVLPGDPARLALGPYATASQVVQFRKELGLDHPLPVQFANYVNGFFHGDLGPSLNTKRNVMQDLRQFFPASFELVTVAMVISLVVGIPLGVRAAIRQDKAADHSSRLVALSGVSLPEYWAGIMLQLVFASYLGLLPTIGRVSGEAFRPFDITGLYLLDSLITLNGRAFVDSLWHLALPALVLSLASLAQITRMTRAGMIGEKFKDYILAARSNGMPENLLIYKYMLKNMFTSTLTLIGLTYGFLLGNAFVVETVFTWPGMGRYGVNSILNNDFNAIVGVAVVVGLGFIVINLIVDLLYGYLDPRVKYGKA